MRLAIEEKTFTETNLVVSEVIWKCRSHAWTDYEKKFPNMFFNIPPLHKKSLNSVSVHDITLNHKYYVLVGGNFHTR